MARTLRLSDANGCGRFRSAARSVSSAQDDRCGDVSENKVRRDFAAGRKAELRVAIRGNTGRIPAASQFSFVEDLGEDRNPPHSDFDSYLVDLDIRSAQLAQRYFERKGIHVSADR